MGGSEKFALRVGGGRWRRGRRLGADFSEEGFEFALFQLDGEFGGARAESQFAERGREREVEVEADHFAVLLDLRAGGFEFFADALVLHGVEIGE